MASSRVAGVEALLRPRSVVVIGASAKAPGSGNAVLANIRDAVWQSDIHVVHPTAAHVDGVDAVPTVQDLPYGIDAALVSLPASRTLTVLQDLEAHGVRAALVPSAGFAAADRAALAEFASGSRMAVHGPNCMGLVNVSDDVPLWFYDDILTRFERGPVALVSQSGSAVFLARATEGVGFSKVVSTGDELGITNADYLHWLAEDAQTSAVGVVLESIRDVPAFVDAIRALREADKPVVVLKVGRTALGAAATRAHTGALVGASAGYSALFARLDVPLVSDYDELATALTCLGTPGLPRARGTAAAVVTDSGGEAGAAADLSVRQGVRLPQFSAATRTALRTHLPGITPDNPLDAGAVVDVPDDYYLRSYTAAIQDENVDALLVIAEAHHTLTRAELDYSVELCEAMRAVVEVGSGKPVIAVSSSSTATSPEFRSWLGPRIPLVRGIANALSAVRVLAGNGRPVPPPATRPPRLPSTDVVADLRAHVVAAGDAVQPDLARRVLQSYGLPYVASVVVPDADAAESAALWAHGRYPVVVKVASRDVAHRSEVGGVVLGVTDDDALRRAITGIRAAVAAAVPSARIDGFEIQQQVPAGVEAMIGFSADPVFGAVVSLGSGGTLVEIAADLATGLAPVTVGESRDLISSTRLGTVLSGYRNLVATTDLTPLATAVENLSWLAADLGDVLAECDLNPVVVEPGTGSVVAVDVLLVPSSPRT